MGIGQNILREMKEEREIELLKQAVNDKKLIGNMGQPLFFNEKLSLIGCNGQPIIRKNGKLIDNLGLPVVILSRELEELMLELG